MFVSPRAYMCVCVCVCDGNRPANVNKDNPDKCSYMSNLALQEAGFFKPQGQ